MARLKKWMRGTAVGLFAVATGTLVHGWYLAHWDNIASELPIRAAVMMPLFVLGYSWMGDGSGDSKEGKA